MMKRYSVAFVLLVLALAPAARAQTPIALWQPAAAPPARSGTKPEAGRWFSLDAAQLATRLAPAPPETRPQEAVVLELPYPDGRLHRFAITRVPVLAPALAARYPEIQTYAGRGLDESTATMRLPATATTLGRLKIQALGNVFFAINNANITLAGTPLPVELAAFSAEARGPVAHLAWTTATKKNNAGFEVEASADGRTFRRLGWVAGQGSSSTAHAYQFDDGTLAAATGPQVYYRLRQLDTDGTATFSPVRTVAVPASRLAQLQLWPNPARGTVAVGGVAPGQAVQLLDLTGRVLPSAVLPAEGPLQLALPAGLAPGVYLVRSGSQTRRLAVE